MTHLKVSWLLVADMRDWDLTQLAEYIVILRTAHGLLRRGAGSGGGSSNVKGSKQQQEQASCCAGPAGLTRAAPAAAATPVRLLEAGEVHAAALQPQRCKALDQHL